MLHRVLLSIHGHRRLHTALAVYLIERHSQDLVNCSFTDARFFGKIALHICCVSKDPRLLRLLLRHGADVNRCVFGTYFIPYPQHKWLLPVLEEFDDPALKKAHQSLRLNNNEARGPDKHEMHHRNLPENYGPLLPSSPSSSPPPLPPSSSGPTAYGGKRSRAT